MDHFLRPIPADDDRLPDAYLEKIQLGMEKRLFSRKQLHDAWWNAYFQLFFVEDYEDVAYHRIFWLRKSQTWMVRAYTAWRGWTVSSNCFELFIDICAALIGVILFSIANEFRNHLGVIRIEGIILRIPMDSVRFFVWYYLWDLNHAFLGDLFPEDRIRWKDRLKDFCGFSAIAIILETWRTLWWGRIHEVWIGIAIYWVQSTIGLLGLEYIFIESPSRAAIVAVLLNIVILVSFFDPLVANRFAEQTVFWFYFIKRTDWIARSMGRDAWKRADSHAWRFYRVPMVSALVVLLMDSIL